MITRLALLGLAALGACGGADPPAAGAPATNAFTGTAAVTTAFAGGTTCQGTPQVVVFLAAGAGANVHTVSVAGGGCIQFNNSDSSPHRPSARSAVAGCAGLTAPAAVAPGGSFITAPLGAPAGPISCDWEDALNPPGGGGY